MDRSSFHRFFILLGICLAGCSGADTHVSGTVLRADGSPFAGISVVARCEETGKSFFGTTDQSGYYELSNQAIPTGLTPGDYLVTVAETSERSNEFVPATIPPKYSSYNMSGLTFHLSPGESKVFDIKLEPMQAPKGGKR